MSAWIVDKTHVDLLVRVALRSGRDNMRWWQVDEQGAYAGWRELDELGRGLEEEQREAAGIFTPDDLGRMLWTENVCSVSYRYPDDTEGTRPGPVSDDIDGDAIEYRYTDPGYTLTPGETFKAIDCLDYQSCEHPGWITSEAYAFLRVLRDRLCAQVDGYEREAGRIAGKVTNYKRDGSTVPISSLRSPHRTARSQPGKRWPAVRAVGAEA